MKDITIRRNGFGFEVIFTKKFWERHEGKRWAIRLERWLAHRAAKQFKRAKKEV